MDADTVMENVLDRLIKALAAQLDASAPPALTPGAIEALSALDRPEANLIFGEAGHLVHYGANPQPVETLIRLISDIQRGESAADAEVVPGDEVRLVGKLPTDLVADYDETWLREMVFVVRYVSRTGTVDVQTDLIEDYWITTVPVAAVRPARARSSPRNQAS
jgi:hypothetical protein